MYTKKHLNIISSSYIINIGISTYLTHSPTVITAANSASITVAIVTMLGTLAYHVLTQLRHRDCFKRICYHMISKQKGDHRAMRNYLISSNSDDDTNINS